MIEKVENDLILNENVPCELSSVAQFRVNSLDYFIDNSIGPKFNLIFKSSKLPFNESLVIIKVEIWDAGFDVLRTIIYDRSLREYNSCAHKYVQKYSNSFRALEIKFYDNFEGKNKNIIEYKPNPDLKLIVANFIDKCDSVY